MPVVLSDVVVDVVDAVGKLRADDRLVTSAEQQLNEVEALFDVLTVVQSQLVRRLGDARDVDAFAEVTGRAIRGWLREEIFLSSWETSRYLLCLRRLPSYPVVAEAVDAAEISLAHVHGIITALDKLPVELRATLEPGLVEHAKFCVPEDIASFIDKLLEVLGIDKASDIRRERRHAERNVNLHASFEGQRVLHGTLTPEVGEALARALAKAAQPTGSDDNRTPGQRQHDALGVIADHYLSSDGTPSFAGAPRTAIITIDFETLENQLRDGWITLPDGAKISAATARRLACDAEMIPVVLGSNSEILDIGQANREFTTAQRRAAYLRDGGRCAFPDCRGQVVQLHHIKFKRHGGPATLDNCTWLCAFHHWLLHEGHWALERDPVDGSYLWTGPLGQRRRRKLRSTAPPPSTG